MSYYPPPAPGGPGAYGVPPSPPSNHLVWAILTTLFCCLPLGVVSIVFAAQVNGKWNSGDHAGAIASAKNAKTWAIVSAVLGFILNVILVIVQVAAVSASSTY